MKIIRPSYEILTPIDGDYILGFLEKIGRVCYKSEDRITDDSKCGCEVSGPCNFTPDDKK